MAVFNLLINWYIRLIFSRLTRFSFRLCEFLIEIVLQMYVKVKKILL